MRFLILTQYYPPETGAPQNRLSGLARELKAAGHEVCILTAMPNYPAMEIHDRYKGREPKEAALLYAQIKNLKFRLRLIKNMQIFGVLSFTLAIVSMYFIYREEMDFAEFTFATALILFCISLFLSLIELINSTRSLEIELSDMAGLEDSILDYLKKMIK